MKQTIIILAILLSVKSTQAQLDAIKSTATTEASKAGSGFDVSSLSKGIMGKLTPALSLTNTQKPEVASAVTTYLTGKSKIMSLASSNPAAYTQKQSGLFSTLKSKLTGILVQKQMEKFTSLKPATNTPSNPLSQLFY